MAKTPDESQHMHPKETTAFLEYLFRKHIEARLPALWDYWKPWKYPWQYMKATLSKEAAILRYVTNNCVDLYEVARTFRPSRFEDLARVLREHANFNTRALEIVGLLDCFEAHYREIIQGIEEDSYSRNDHDLLKSLGIQDSDAELRGILSILQSSRVLEQKYEKQSIGQQLHWADKELDRAGEAIAEGVLYYYKSEKEPEVDAEQRREDHRSPIARARFRNLEQDGYEGEEMADNSETSAPKKTMRLFKGLGEISVGVTMSLGDLALALASFQEGKTTQQEIANLFVSTGTGIGVIVKGVGELKGE